MTIIIDSHEDLAWNIVNLQRDYTQSAASIRKAEENTPKPAFNGNTLLGWDQYQEGQVAIVFGTLYCSPQRLDRGKHPVHSYRNPQEAHQCYRENLDAYWRLTDESPDKFRLLLTQADLEQHLAQWQAVGDEKSN
jgi:hypothetical protein